MKYKDAVEIGREEAFELCGGELPTKRIERIIARQVGLGDSIIFKENKKYYVAPCPGLDAWPKQGGNIMNNLNSPYEVLEAIRKAREKNDIKEIARLEKIYNKMMGRK